MTASLYRPEILNEITSAGVPHDLLSNVVEFAGRPSYVDSEFKGEVYLRSTLATMNGHVREFFAEKGSIPLEPNEAWLESRCTDKLNREFTYYLISKTPQHLRKKTFRRMRKALGIVLDDPDTYMDFLRTYKNTNQPRIMISTTDRKIYMEEHRETMRSLHSRIDTYWDILDETIETNKHYDPISVSDLS